MTHVRLPLLHSYMLADCMACCILPDNLPAICQVQHLAYAGADAGLLALAAHERQAVMLALKHQNALCCRTETFCPVLTNLSTLLDVQAPYLPLAARATADESHSRQFDAYACFKKALTFHLARCLMNHMSKCSCHVSICHHHDHHIAGVVADALL